MPRHGNMTAQHAAPRSGGGVLGRVGNSIRVPRGRHSFVTASLGVGVSPRKQACPFVAATEWRPSSCYRHDKGHSSEWPASSTSRLPSGCLGSALLLPFRPAKFHHLRNSFARCGAHRATSSGTCRPPRSTPCFPPFQSPNSCINSVALTSEV